MKLKKLLKISVIFTLFSIQIGTCQTQIGNNIDGEAANDFSGHGLAISSDGSVVAVGAAFNDQGGNAAGHVRVFKNIANVWTQLGSDIDGAFASGNTGQSLALSGNGLVLAVATLESPNFTGQVDVYNFNGTNWIPVGSSIFGVNNFNYAGQSLSLSFDGSILAVNELNFNGTGNDLGQVRVFQNVANSWTQIGASIIGTLNSGNFGISIDLSANGNTLAIGSDLYNENGTQSGTVKIFRLVANNWVQLGANINGLAPSERIGRNVCISDDGLVVSFTAISTNPITNQTASTARVYHNLSNTWTKIGNDLYVDGHILSSGRNLSMSSDGSIIALSQSNLDSGTGLVKIFQNSGGGWQQVGSDINGVDVDELFGYSIALSADGTKLVSAAPKNTATLGIRTGRTRVYNLPIPGTILSFEGTNDYVNFSTPSIITMAQFTTEFWLRPASNSALNQRILSTNSDTFEIAIGSDNKIRIYDLIMGWQDGPTVVQNTWQHITIVKNSSNYLIYVNGSLTNTIASTNTVDQFSLFRLGARYSNTLENANFSIDELKIWNFSKTAIDVANQFACISAGTETGLVTYFRFNQGLAGFNNVGITNLLATTGTNGTLQNFSLIGNTSNWLQSWTALNTTNCSLLSIETKQLNAEISIYPNPTNHILNIENINNISASFEIFDLNGRKVLNGKLNKNSNQITVENLQNGIYILKLKKDNEFVIKQIIKN
jgi:hypothetical protein